MSKSTVGKFIDGEDWLNVIIFTAGIAAIGVVTLVAVLTVLTLFGVT